MRRAIALFVVCSLVAVLAGCWAAAAHGVPASVWMRNPAAWVVGDAAGLTRWRAAGLRVVGLAAGLAALAATLLAPGTEGVHRWLGVGGLRLNMAELVLPAMVVGLVRTPDAWSWLVAGAVGVVLALKPDASQAVAFAAAMLAGAAVTRRFGRVEAAAMAVLVTAATIACFRRDPLPPVAEVEGVMRLAAEVSPLLAGLAALVLTGAVLALCRTPPARTRRPERRSPRTWGRAAQRP